MVSYKALNTLTKSTISNGCHTIGNIYVSESITLSKSTISNIFNTIGDIYVSESITTFVSIIS